SIRAYAHGCRNEASPDRECQKPETVPAFRPGDNGRDRIASPESRKKCCDRCRPNWEIRLSFQLEPVTERERTTNSSALPARWRVARDATKMLLCKRPPAAGWWQECHGHSRSRTGLMPL